MAHTCIHCGGRCSCDHDIGDMMTGPLSWCVGCGCEDDVEEDYCDGACVNDANPDLWMEYNCHQAEEEEQEEKITDPFSKGSFDY